jgi:hypothetical protein
VNIERKFLRVLGLVKTSILLAFTVAGYNIDRIRSFIDRMAVEATAPRKRAKRRQGTWADLLGEAYRPAGRDPPSGSDFVPINLRLAPGVMSLPS